MQAFIDMKLEGGYAITALLIGAVVILVGLWLIVRRGVKVKAMGVELDPASKAEIQSISSAVNHQGKDEPRLIDLVKSIDRRVATMDERMNQIQGSVNTLSEQMSDHIQAAQGAQARVDHLDARVTKLESKLDPKE